MKATAETQWEISLGTKLVLLSHHHLTQWRERSMDYYCLLYKYQKIWILITCMSLCLNFISFLNWISYISDNNGFHFNQPPNSHIKIAKNYNTTVSHTKTALFLHSFFKANLYPQFIALSEWIIKTSSRPCLVNVTLCIDRNMVFSETNSTKNIH